MYNHLRTPKNENEKPQIGNRIKNFQPKMHQKLTDKKQLSKNRFIRDAFILFELNLLASEIIIRELTSRVAANLFVIVLP